MANKYYPKGAEKELRGQINYVADDIRAVIVSSSYTFSAAHEFASDLGAIIGTPVALANKTDAGGVFDADDAVFGSLAPGSTAKAVVIIKYTGNLSTSPVIHYFDEITGFPFPTNGGDVTVPWSDGPYKILALV